MYISCLVTILKLIVFNCGIAKNANFNCTNGKVEVKGTPNHFKFGYTVD